MKYLLTVTALILCLYPLPLIAAQPLSTGDKIPDNFKALDQHNNPQTLETLRGEKGTVILFVRSLDWCPYCKAQITEMNDNLQLFTEAGFKVVSVSYDNTDTLKNFAEQKSIKFHLLSDPESQVIDDFGILSKEHKPDTRFYGIPQPTIYILDKSGTITAILSEEGYKTRPPLEDILKALE